VNAVERVKIPAGLIRVPRGVREVVAAFAILDDDLPMRLEVVSAQEKFLARGEEDVPVFQESAKGDVVGIGKYGAMSPRLGVVLRQKDLSISEPEGLAAALRIDVGPLRREATPEVLGFTSDGGAEGELRAQRPADRCRGGGC
jgi:hypothetical protein